MNTAATIEAHRIRLTLLHKAKERLTSVRMRGKQHKIYDTEARALEEIRRFERDIAHDRKNNLHCWAVVEKDGSPTRVEYTAWEPSSLFQHGSFRQHDDHGVIGRIGTRPLPQDIEDMRGGSPERIAAVAAWNEAENREAFLAIVGRYPEAAAGEMKHGRITVKEQG